MLPAFSWSPDPMTDQEQKEKQGRMLVVKLSSLGDLFHVLPAVTMIRRSLSVTVDWVTQPEYVDLVRCFDGVKSVIAFPRRTFAAGFPSFLRELRVERYDFILDFQGLLKSAIAARCARGGRRIGPSYSREGAHLFYHEIAGRKDKARHAVEEALDFVRHLNIEVGAPEFPVSFSAMEPAGNSPRVVLAPCSRWPTKNWPPERFILVGRGLKERAGATLFLVGAPGDRAVCEQIERGIGAGVVNLCGRTSLVELGSLMQQMNLAITVDSGPMHMAAAVGVPVLAVFGATDPKRTGPYGKAHRVLVTEGLECRPCFSDVCRRGDLACLDRVSADEVLDAALDMLKLNRK